MSHWMKPKTNLCSRELKIHNHVIQNVSLKNNNSLFLFFIHFSVFQDWKPQRLPFSHRFLRQCLFGLLLCSHKSEGWHHWATVQRLCGCCRPAWARDGTTEWVLGDTCLEQSLVLQETQRIKCHLSNGKTVVLWGLGNGPGNPTVLKDHVMQCDFYKLVHVASVLYKKLSTS